MINDIRPTGGLYLPADHQWLTILYLAQYWENCLPSLVQWMCGKGGSLVTSHEKNAALPSTTRWSLGRFTNWGAPTSSATFITHIQCELII